MVIPEFNIPLIVVTLCFMGLDILTGFIQAVYNKDVSSTIMKKGLRHKSGFVLIIILALLCEYSIYYIDLGFTLPIANFVCGFIIATEVISIIENVGKLSPELTNTKLLSIFQTDKIKDMLDDENDD